MPAESISAYVIGPHAAFEMGRRGISADTVQGVMSAPEQRLHVRLGRVVLQSRVDRGAERKAALVRVFVDIDRVPAVVVTVYATSKVAKYWRPVNES